MVAAYEADDIAYQQWPTAAKVPSKVPWRRRMSATKPPNRRGKPATDPAIRAATLQHALAHGVRAASERFSIPESTIRNWQARARKRGELVPSGSLQHGTYSEKEITKRADLLRGELFRIAPDLEEQRFSTAVAEYLKAIARAQLAHNALMAGDPARPNTRLLGDSNSSGQARSEARQRPRARSRVRREAEGDRR